ncbi:quinone oxidoreductase [Paenibacillus sp. N1-5-1-14]|uniref:quinone oxidoreductase family protein n=1 Tax=Paenibacillus radicibacter TaxID=2972488 RepID=UPI0021592F22|nr:quinone oxidoreductase [Paenibacillus radicibacter]MCR8645374.1 quinone oxidoreductase [Paenibacillus radicibacter]
MRALIFEVFGGPEVLRYAEIAEPRLELGTVIVRMQAIGLNFADIYRRRGNYHLTGQPPYILGYEGAGIVERVATDVTALQPGDRVAFADVPYANAELVQVPVERAIPLPSDITAEQAASVLLQGMTAHYLVNDSYAVQHGDEMLVHAAAGGVGQLLVQLGVSKGARVLGLTSSPAKREVARSAGADEVLLYDSDWVQSAIHWSQGVAGVRVAYDSVGSTLMDSFAAVQTKGHVVFYGMAGGDPALIDPRMLMDTSKTITGGDLWNHVTSRADRMHRAEALFAAIRSGALRLEEPKTFALADGIEAHRLLESRKSTGKILLIP